MTTNGPFGIERDTALRHHTFNACDELDAALFTGDEFVSNIKARDELRTNLARWSKQLDELADAHAKMIVEEYQRTGRIEVEESPVDVEAEAKRLAPEVEPIYLLALHHPEGGFVDVLSAATCDEVIAHLTTWRQQNP